MPLPRKRYKKGYKKEYLVKTGLCYETDDHRLQDRFWGRVIFPVHTLSGKVVAFGGRVLAGATKGVKVKYVNSPESEIYHKSNELYGIYFAKQAIVKQDRCFLVEGYTDVISMHQSGIENVVASSGTALTPGQIRMIHRFTNNMTVLYDGDAAGIKASIRGIDMLLEEGMNIKVCLLPDGDDPDSFASANITPRSFKPSLQNMKRTLSVLKPTYYWKMQEKTRSNVQSLSVIWYKAFRSYRKRLYATSISKNVRSCCT